MRRVLGVLVLLAGAARGGGQPVPTPLRSVDPIAWMAGDWESEVKIPNAAMSKVVNHYRPALGGKAMTVETTINGAERYRGLIGYDPAKKSMAFWYVMTTGESTQGTVAQGDGYSLFDFNVTSADGKSTHAQVHIVQVDPDHYKWEFYAGPTMGKLYDIAYRRVK